MTLAELNAYDRPAFAAALGWIFEGSPWVAERAWEAKPFATLDALHDAMISIVRTASAEEQTALLCAHPDLGASRVIATNGRVSLRADPLSRASRQEQAGAGLDALTVDELERFVNLNGAYREKFGFPFICAVKGRTKHDILSTLERQLASTRDVERQESLRQVYR